MSCPSSTPPQGISPTWLSTAPPGLQDPPRQGGLGGLIRRYPLTGYFVLANLLSWVAWLPYALSNQGMGVWDFDFPALLGTTQLAGVLPGAYLGPIFSAYLVTRLTEGKEGVRRWIGRMTKWQVHWGWYAGAALGVPAVLIVTSLAVSDGAAQVPPMVLLVAYIPGLLLQMITTGLAEEPGWRDFALARMQRRYGPLRATAILGPLWGVWHLPLYLTEWGGYPDVTWQRIGIFVVFASAFSFVITWVFNRTGQSLPLVIVLHVSVNNFMSIIYSDMFPSIADPDSAGMVTLLAGLGAALVVLIATRGKLGYRPEAGRSH
ncbi:CPBP family intramembrane glutamic endopeptidase [Nonomuraea salmonea]|uniref:CPBP family intramembrane glutamic endopeptidase n=1 Tax=Nonomuraea salmonea TaxID=46181 RepID=UPI0031E79393